MLHLKFSNDLCLTNTEMPVLYFPLIKYDCIKIYRHMLKDTLPYLNPLCLELFHLVRYYLYSGEFFKLCIYTLSTIHPLYFLTNQHSCLKWSKHMAAAKRRFDHQHYKVVMATTLSVNLFSDCNSIDKNLS